MRSLLSLVGVVGVSAVCNLCPLPALDAASFLPCLKAEIGEDCCVTGRPMVNNPCIKVWLKNPLLATFAPIIEKARVACKVDHLASCDANVQQACPDECGPAAAPKPAMPAVAVAGAAGASPICSLCPLPPMNSATLVPCLNETIGEDCCVVGRPLITNPCAKVWLKNPMLAAFSGTIEKARVACKVDQIANCDAAVQRACPNECGPASSVCGLMEEYTTCHSSSCWEDKCVDNKVVVAGPICTADCKTGCRCVNGTSRDAVSNKCISALQCSNNTSVTPCQARAAFEKAACGGRMGCDTSGAKCKPDGSFESTQCRGSTGYCWCVDSDGKEIEGSRKGPTEGQPNCAAVAGAGKGKMGKATKNGKMAKAKAKAAPRP